MSSSVAVRPTVDEADEAAGVEVRGLVKAYGDHRAVDDVSFVVRPGEFFSLLGPSGCGKSTTLRCIGGFVAPDAGGILVEGADVVGVPPHRRNVNTVFQNYALFPHMSVRENVGFGLREAGVARAEAATRVGEALDLVQLGSFAERRPSQLSGGQQQRVALARALVNRPAVLLLDEPMGALDLKLRRQMQLELKDIQRDTGISFIHVTHDQEEALSMSDRMGIMHGGRLVQSGTPDEIYERPTTAFVADFVGTTTMLAGRLRDAATFVLSGGDAVAVTSVAPGIAGESLLCLRPEAVHLSVERVDEGNALQATVREVLYEGPAITYVLEIAGGVRLLASRQNRLGSPGPGYEPGSRLWASWELPAGRVVAAD